LHNKSILDSFFGSLRSTIIKSTLNFELLCKAPSGRGTMNRVLVVKIALMTGCTGANYCD
jgi:hypothetical protein